jgi:hypothetical protein
LTHAPTVPAQLSDYAECALLHLELGDLASARRLLAATAPLRAPSGGYYDTPPSPLIPAARPALPNARLALAFSRAHQRPQALAILRTFHLPLPEIALALLATL